MSIVIKKKYRSRNKSRKNVLKTKKYILRGGKGKAPRAKTSEPAPQKETRSLFARARNFTRKFTTEAGRKELANSAALKASRAASYVSEKAAQFSTPKKVREAVTATAETVKNFPGALAYAVQTPGGQAMMLEKAGRMDEQVEKFQEKLKAFGEKVGSTAGRALLVSNMQAKFITPEERTKLKKNISESSVGTAFTSLKEKIKGAKNFVQKRALEALLEQADKRNPAEAALIRADIAALETAPI